MFRDKQELKVAIREHLRVHGARNWQVLRLKYGSVSDATWWRCIREVKTELQSRALATALEDSTVRAEPNSRMLGPGSAIGPVHLLASGGARHIDYLSAFTDLNDGIEQLRSYALRSDGEIRFPGVFERALKMKEKLVSQCVHWTDRIYSARGQQAFYDAVLAEIMVEAPVIQHRIIDRLHLFQQRST